jgi:hypothetical protein
MSNPMSTRMLRLAAVAAALIVAACTGAAPSASPAASPATPPASTIASPTASPSPAPTVEPSEEPSLPPESARPTVPASANASGATTTVTDWGEIWDRLPAGFPAYPGARPTVTGGDPATAVLDLAADGSTTSTWYQAALKAAGWTIVGANGPREDGSFDIVASKGGDDCQAEISLAPLGTTTTATIYVAAACPLS